MATEETAPSPTRAAAAPPVAEHHTEEEAQGATPPSPTRVATPPVQEETEEGRMDEGTVVGPPPEEEEAPSRGADASEAATDAAATEGASGAPEEQEAVVPPEATSAEAGGERTPSPQRILEVGNGGGAATSPQATPETAVSPRQEASGASTRIEASAPRHGAGILVQRRRGAHRRAVVDHALQALGVVQGELVREELALAAEQDRLSEAWSLLRERVELCRRQDAAAQAERQEALRFAEETRDSVKREAQEVMDQLDAGGPFQQNDFQEYLRRYRQST